MFQKLLAAACAALLILQAVMASNVSSKSAADAKFEELANRFIAEYLEMNPEAATQLGNHAYDNRLNDYSMEGVQKSRRFAEKYLSDLNNIKLAELSRTNSVDARILRESLEYSVFQIDVLRGYENNPMSYNIGSALDYLISRDFAPLSERLKNLQGRIEMIPAVTRAAKANLKNPPRIYTETAIQQNQGLIGLIRNGLSEFGEGAIMQSSLQTSREKAIVALEDYGKWLKDDLLPRSNGDFRLGEAKYRQKLKFALSSDLSKEELLKRAEDDLKATQNKMYRVALPLYKKYFPASEGERVMLDRKTVIKGVLNKLAESRPNNQTIVPNAERDLAEATEFVRKNNLVDVPTEPVNVIEMPEYARGSAVAYCDSTGPFEKNSSTFYAISPTPKDWSAARVESFYKEYNDYMLEDLTIHEAMPGHYLQLMHANRFKAPTPIRAVFGSGSFVEGWAVYAEQMMAEKGYGGAEVEMQQLKMKLRVIINSIIDQKIHSAGMTEKEAIDLMMNEGFQEEGEAAGKWKRAQLSSTQLSTYYVGSVEVNDLRKAYEAKHGKQTEMRKMHDAMLSFGSPPAKYVKELLGL
jgi:uncharacterized protein (DUF885 family)